LDELRHLRELAKGSGQYAAAITAETKRGEAAGFYIKRRENITPPLSPGQTLDRFLSCLSEVQLRQLGEIATIHHTPMGVTAAGGGCYGGDVNPQMASG